MKKKILLALTAVAAGLVALTGCQKENPYSSYGVGAEFIGLPTHENGANYTKEEATELPAAQRDQYFVADYLAGWLINNGYVRTSLANPLTIEGADLAYNDQIAYDFYQNETKRLDQVDLDKVIADAQKLTGSSSLELTTSGTVSFMYSLTRTTTLPSGTSLSKQYTVNYSPLSGSTTNPE